MFLLTIILTIPNDSVKADTIIDYAFSNIKIGTRNNVAYEITDLQLTSTHLIIKGWSFANLFQNHNSTTSHRYFIELINRKNLEVSVYQSQPYNIDKTNLVKMQTTNRKCNDNEYYQNEVYCYSDLSWSGFEFYIPISNLDSNTEYSINFAINLNRVNETHYFLNGIVIPGFENLELIDNGRKYSLAGQLSTWEFKVITDYVLNRNIAGKGSSPNRTAYPHCRVGDTTIYWYNGGTYYNYKGSSWLGSGLSKELWINLGYNSGNIVCQTANNFDSIQTVLHGINGSGWISTAFLNYTGEPTTLKIDSLESAKINSLTTFTTSKDVNSKIILNVDNLINQKININIQYENKSIYNQDITFIGNKDVVINDLNIGSNGVIKAEITEPSGKKHNITASIYVASEETIHLNNINNDISITTPIIVEKITNQPEKNYYEKFNIRVPHNNIGVVAGQGFNAYANILYKSDVSEIKLNNFNGKILFEQQDISLDYPIINSLVNVQLLKEIKSENNVFLNIPKIYITKDSGKLYKEKPIDIPFIDGGNKWYVDMNSELKTYDYIYKIDNLGVNLINVNINARYTITKRLLGNNGLFKIKRVWPPNKLNYIFKKTYTYFDLLREVGEF